MRADRHSGPGGLAAPVLCALLLLTACGPSPPPGPLTTATAGPAPTVTVPFEMPVVISLAGFFDEQTLALLHEQIAAFEAANAGVRVELLDVNPDPDRRQEEFAASLAAGETGIDIYLVSPHWLAGYAAPGWLRPLDDYLTAQGLDRDAFLPASVAASTLEGRLMALPWSVDGGLLYYRSDLLAAAGYAPPASWAELEAMASELTGGQGPAHGYVWQGDEYDGLTCNTLEQIWAAGGDVLDAEGQPIFDSPATRAALEGMARYLTEGVSPAEVVTYQEEASLADFTRGSAVFMRNWSPAWDHVQEPASPVAGEVGLAPLPASCLGGQSLVLSASSLLPEEAFRFMAFLVAPEQQAQLALGSQQAPALEGIYQDADSLARAPVLAELYRAFLAARPRPAVPDYAGLSEAIYTEVHRLLLGSQDAAATARNVQARLEALLAGE